MVELSALNAMAVADFVAVLGGVFEHSAWVADRVAGQRPFASVAALHGAMVAAVAGAGEALQMGLLRAHPVLARPASLTQASAAEQGGHGLTSLGEDEAARFGAANAAYDARFGFPFIIAVRGQRDRAAILAALERRLAGGEEERATALAEVGKIARFRLDDLVAPAGWLSVHVLDTARGTPGAGMEVTLDRLGEPGAQRLGRWRTNADGRCDEKLLSGPAMLPGQYELVFAVGDWRRGNQEADLGFYDAVPIRVRIDDPSVHYHVPLLVAPYGYSTYRGS